MQDNLRFGLGEQVTSNLAEEKTLVGFMTLRRRSFLLTCPHQTNVLDIEPHTIKTCMAELRGLSSAALSLVGGW